MLVLFKYNFNPKENAYLYGNLSPLLTSKIDKKEFKEELYAYILNNNEIVRNFYKENDPDFYNKYINFKYSLDDLIAEINSLIK